MSRGDLPASFIGKEASGIQATTSYSIINVTSIAGRTCISIGCFRMAPLCLLSPIEANENTAGRDLAGYRMKILTVGRLSITATADRETAKDVE
jgi:hypothetical protein